MSVMIHDVHWTLEKKWYYPSFIIFAFTQTIFELLLKIFSLGFLRHVSNIKKINVVAIDCLGFIIEVTY